MSLREKRRDGLSGEGKMTAGYTKSLYRQEGKEKTEWSTFRGSKNTGEEDGPGETGLATRGRCSGAMKTKKGRQKKTKGRGVR